jgi:signal transduction histidine kinase/CheY-like chemotaxis protein
VEVWLAWLDRLLPAPLRAPSVDRVRARALTACALAYVVTSVVMGVTMLAHDDRDGALIELVATGVGLATIALLRATASLPAATIALASMYLGEVAMLCVNAERLPPLLFGMLGLMPMGLRIVGGRVAYRVGLASTSLTMLVLAAVGADRDWPVRSLWDGHVGLVVEYFAFAVETVVLTWAHFALSAFALERAEGHAAEAAAAQRAAEAALTETNAHRGALETALRARAHFLAMMSHELRTPLNGIIGSARALVGADEATRAEAAADIESSGLRLLALVSRTLDVAQLESGRLRLERGPFAPGAFVRARVEATASRAARLGVALAVTLDDRLPAWVEGDRARLEHALDELLDNALRFGARHVRVSAHVTGEALVVEVCDDGPGVPAARVPRLFEPFEPSESGDQGRTDGVGLGLARARGIARGHGGDLSFAPAHPRGARFTLTVPLVLVAAPQRRSIDGALEVLIVDDNVVNRRVARRLVERMGWSGREAAGGYAAIAAVEASCPDLVLMDCQMPDLDGFEATRHIRARPPPQPMIVALTAADTAETAAAARAAGMDGFLVKPASEPALRAEVASILARLDR